MSEENKTNVGEFETTNNLLYDNYRRQLKNEAYSLVKVLNLGDLLKETTPEDHIYKIFYWPQPGFLGEVEWQLPNQVKAFYRGGKSADRKTFTVEQTYSGREFCLVGISFSCEFEPEKFLPNRITLRFKKDFNLLKPLESGTKEEQVNQLSVLSLEEKLDEDLKNMCNTCDNSVQRLIKLSRLSNYEIILLFNGKGELESQPDPKQQALLEILGWEQLEDNKKALDLKETFKKFIKGELKLSLI